MAQRRTLVSQTTIAAATTTVSVATPISSSSTTSVWRCNLVLRNAPLNLDPFAVDFVLRIFTHSIFDSIGGTKCHIPKAPGFLGNGICHHDGVLDLPELPKVLVEHGQVARGRQPADKQLHRIEWGITIP